MGTLGKSSTIFTLCAVLAACGERGILVEAGSGQQLLHKGATQAGFGGLSWQPARKASGSAATKGMAPARQTLPEAVTLTVHASTSALEIIGDLLSASRNRSIAPFHAIIEPSSDRGAIAALIEGGDGIALVCHPPDSDEQRYGLRNRLLGYHVMTLAAHRDNPVRTLPAPDLRAILTGEVNGWAPLGWGARPIRLLAPRPGHLCDLAARLLIPGDRFSANAVLRGSDEDILATVAKDQHALGIVPLAALTQRPDLRALAIDLIAPTHHEVRASRYRYACPLRVLWRGPPSEGLERFLAFLDSNGGKQALASRVTTGE